MKEQILTIPWTSHSATGYGNMNSGYVNEDGRQGPYVAVGFPHGQVEGFFNYDFTPQRPMIINEITLESRADVFAGVSWAASIYIGKYQGGQWRYKRAWRGHLNDAHVLTLGDGAWNSETVAMRRFLCKPGTKVRIRVRCALEAVGDSRIRVGNLKIWYRTTPNVFLERRARSLFSGQILPLDNLIVSGRASDPETGVDIASYPLHGWIASRSPEVSFGTIMTGSLTDFAPFSVLGVPGTEDIEFRSEGYAEAGANDDFLGIKTLLTDDEELDADPTQNESHFVDAVTSIYDVQKRTPVLAFFLMLSQIRLGDTLNLQGSVIDPLQPALRDFMPDAEVTLRRYNSRIDAAFIGLATGNPSDIDGSYSIPWTTQFGGENIQWKVTSANTTQYNPAESQVQTRTVWQILDTITEFLLSRNPPFFLGSTVDWIVKVVLGDGVTPVIEGTTSIIGDPSGEHSGPLLTDGTFSYTKWLETEHTFLLYADYSGATKDGYIQYNPSTSSAVAMASEWKISATNLTEILLQVGELIKGELAQFSARLVDASGNPLANRTVSLQRKTASGWANVLVATTRGDGKVDFTWDPQSLLVGDSIDIECRVRFGGAADTSTVPGEEWITYQETVTTSDIFTLFQLPPWLGHVIMRCKFNTEQIQPLLREGIATILLEISPADYEGRTQYSIPTTVSVNPGTYTVTCILTVRDIEYTDSITREVGENEDVYFDFAFFSEIQKKEGYGRLIVTLVPSDTVILKGQTLDLSGSVSYPSRIRSIGIPGVKVRFFANNKPIGSSRANLQGQYLFALILDAVGEIELHAQVSGPQGQFILGKSPTLSMSVA